MIGSTYYVHPDEFERIYSQIKFPFVPSAVAGRHGITIRQHRESTTCICIYLFRVYACTKLIHTRMTQCRCNALEITMRPILNASSRTFRGWRGHTMPEQPGIQYTLPSSNAIVKALRIPTMYFPSSELLTDTRCYYRRFANVTC